MDNLGGACLYLYLWNQYTLTLKNHVKAHTKFKVAKNNKNFIDLWYNNTTTINLAQMHIMKVDLNLISIYEQDIELSDYYDLFAAQAEVALKCGVDYRDEIITTLIAEEVQAKNNTMSVPSKKRNYDIKLERELNVDDLWDLVDKEENTHK